MQAGRVAEPVAQHRQHRLQDPRVEGRARVVVEVDALHRLIIRAVRPIIALLTDFGTRDHYVGAMKGAILSIAPSSRRGLAVATKSYRFVAPDNGLLTEVLAEHPTARVHTLSNRRLWNAEVAPTFHARDVFGPVAAHLARGTRLDRVGPKVADAVRLPAVTVRALGADAWESRVVLVDRFGNLITNVTVRALDGMIAGSDRTDVVVRVGGVIAPLVRTYSDVLPGEPCALVGSSGRLELALNGGSAASVAGVGRGASVLVRRVYQPAI
jgi:S-adenosyl-L-methionine hydrolase (adenosine-forming)